MRFLVCFLLVILVVMLGCGDPFEDLGVATEEPTETELSFLAPANSTNPWTIEYGPIGGDLSSLIITGPEVSISVSYDTPFRIRSIESDIINTENLVSLVSDGSLLILNQTIPVELIENDDNGNRGFYVFEVRKHDNQIVSGYHNVPGFADENIVNPGEQITWKPTPVNTRTFTLDAKLDPVTSSEAQRSWASLGLDVSKVQLNVAKIRAVGGSEWSLPSSITVSEGESANYEIRFSITDGSIEADTVYNAILIINNADFTPNYFTEDGHKRWFGVKFSFNNGYAQYQATDARDIRDPFSFGADDDPGADLTPETLNLSQATEILGDANVVISQNEIVMTSGAICQAELAISDLANGSYKIQGEIYIDDSGLKGDARLQEKTSGAHIDAGNDLGVYILYISGASFSVSDGQAVLKFDKPKSNGTAKFKNIKLIPQ